MKELSIEEKAKAYDAFLTTLYDAFIRCCNDWFDEDKKEMYYKLKESEDNIVVNALISGINGLLKTEYHLKGIGGISFNRIIDWLKNQGKKDEEILVLKDQIESLNAAIKAIKETHRIELKKKGEQKSAAWSEEDETRIINIIIMLKEGASLHFHKNDIAKAVDWLKHLKDKMQPKSE